MKIRQSNYELMRIVSMLLIVLYHILSHGQVLHNTTGVMHLIVIFLLCITMVHVNSFVMLTGYFNYNKTFSIKKFFKTFNMMWFYQVAIIIVLTICGYDIISGKYQLINDISPFNIIYS